MRQGRSQRQPPKKRCPAEWIAAFFIDPVGDLGLETKTMADNAIVIIPLRVQESALGTLGAQTSADLEAAHDTEMLSSFLAKRARVDIMVAGLTDQEGPLYVMMTRGEATQAEIASAIQTGIVRRDDVQQGEIRRVLWETARMLAPIGDGGTKAAVHIDVSLGGGKGIPFDEGQGWNWSVFNSGAQLTTGAAVSLFGSLMGVWLN